MWRERASVIESIYIYMSLGSAKIDMCVCVCVCVKFHSAFFSKSLMRGFRIQGLGNNASPRSSR